MKRRTLFDMLKKYSVFLILFVLLMTACQATQPGSAGETPTATNPTPYENEISPPAAVIAAQKDLAKQLNIAVENITIREIEQVEWPNACLGAAQPDEMCAEVIVDGFRAVLSAKGIEYVYHTNMDGSQVRLVKEPMQQGSPDMPEAILIARQVLSQQIGVSQDEIEVERYEAVEWPNGCLGVEKRGQICTQVITPGYRVIFQAGGKQYEYHTDEKGGLVVMAAADDPKSAEVSVKWEWRSGATCQQAEVDSGSVQFGPCGETTKEAVLQPQRAEELAVLAEKYAPFTADTEAGTVEFSGLGTQTAGEVEQRSIGEWMRLVYMEAESGRSGAAWGMAFTWHREGGIAGFCDDLAVSISGWAQPTSCKGSSPQNFSEYHLSEKEIAQLYAYVDTYASFEYGHKDPAVADAMAIRLEFNGAGKEKATLSQQEEIARFAAGLFAEATK